MSRDIVRLAPPQLRESGVRLIDLGARHIGRKVTITVAGSTIEGYLRGLEFEADLFSGVVAAKLHIDHESGSTFLRKLDLGLTLDVAE